MTQKSIYRFFPPPPNNIATKDDEPSPKRIKIGGDNVSKPMSERMRPSCVDDYVCSSPIILQLMQLQRIPSIILYGKPGSGKTSLALILANRAHGRISKLSAVTASISDVKEIVSRSSLSNPSVLFLDEIHRFNKSQQDYLLPHVESGIIVLIGATTENPFITVNKALLSRCRVVEVPPVTEANLHSILERAIMSEHINISTDAVQRIVDIASGDARAALNLLEQAKESASVLSSDARIEIEDLSTLSTSDGTGLDKGMRLDLISALQKSIRGSHVNAAVLYLAMLLENGEDPLYVARRLVRIASEDVGLAEPFALVLATSAQSTTATTGMPECATALTELVMYLCACPKSNVCEIAYMKAKELVHQKGGSLEVPHNISIRKLGYVYTNQPEIKDAQAFRDVQRYMPQGFDQVEIVPKSFNLPRRR